MYTFNWSFALEVFCCFFSLHKIHMGFLKCYVVKNYRQVFHRKATLAFMTKSAFLSSHKLIIANINVIFRQEHEEGETVT